MLPEIERRSEGRGGDSRPVIGRRDSDAATAFTRKLDATRCSGCGKIICKATRDAVRAGQVIEIKCGCNQLNYLMGSIDATE